MDSLPSKLFFNVDLIRVLGLIRTEDRGLKSID